MAPSALLLEQVLTWIDPFDCQQQMFSSHMSASARHDFRWPSPCRAWHLYNLPYALLLQVFVAPFYSDIYLSSFSSMFFLEWQGTKYSVKGLMLAFTLAPSSVWGEICFSLFCLATVESSQRAARHFLHRMPSFRQLQFPSPACRTSHVAVSFVPCPSF